MKCRLKRPSSSRSGGFLETKGLIKTDKKGNTGYTWPRLIQRKMLVNVKGVHNVKRGY